MDPRYPIGKFEMPKDITAERRRHAIDAIATTPAKMRAAVKGLNDVQLDAPYREGGWTVRQVVHHVPDSHMNAFIRLHIALTEDRPTIRPYEEARWAELDDAKAPIAVSQTLLDALHARWDLTWRGMKPEDFTRPLVHPQQGERSRRLATLRIRMARQTPHGPHHRITQTEKLVA